LADLPLSGSYRKHCAQLTNDLYKPALCGGEDYELLFTARPAHKKKIAQLALKLQVRLTCIGEVTAQGAGLVIVDEAGQTSVPAGEGFRHF